MPNFNRANLALEPLNVTINDALERAAAIKAELPRPYLGASIVGHECARRIQYADIVKLDIGIISCPELLPDLWELADDFPVALDELLAYVHD